MGRGRNSRNNLDPIERITFKTYASFSATSTSSAAPTISSVNVVPAFDARLAAIAEVYQFYRFTKLDVSLFPNINEVTAADTALSCGYIPRFPNAGPTTHTGVLALPASAFKGLSQTMPAKMRVPKSVLIGDSPLNWFQSVAGTEDTQWETQGVVYLAANATVNPSEVIYILEGICEFKGRSLAGQTPLRRPLSNGAPSPKTDVISCDPADEDNRQQVLIGGKTFKLVEA